MPYEGYSKSWGALDAEERNVFPASVLARRLGVKTQAIRELMDVWEKHHTSKRYNLTEFYDGDMLLFVAGKIPQPQCGYDDNDIEDAQLLLTALKAWKPA